MPRLSYQYIFICLFAFGLLSCSGKTENRKTKNIKQIVGERFVLPEHKKWRILDRDTTIQLSSNPKLVVYFNANGCTPCALKELHHWTPILRQLSLMRNDGIYAEAVFILNADANDRDITKTLIEQDFQYPVMYDESGEFEKYNLLPENDFIHTFILDSGNKVKHVGNPLISTGEFLLFQTIIKQIN